ncbi:MAG TPA: histidine kinase [Bryobacteraceae bacterium]|nr:histidine kinase [Bryobacteraceae bacterium]
MPETALAEMLFGALNEHEVTLARVSRLLHDDVSQVLSAAGLQLDALRMDFGESAPGVGQRVVEIQGMLEQAIDRLRGISNELNPSIAERAGLHFALEQLTGKARGSFSGSIRLHFDSSVRVPPAEARTFYKIAEYAMSAAVQRQACSLIDLQFKRAQGRLVLEIADNGEFTGADAKAKTFGMLLIEYHAAKSDFQLSAGGSPAVGNVLRVSCPAAARASG